MADRRDYFFRQKVTEAELDAGFNGLEAADFNLAVDHDLIGIVEGFGVSQHAGSADLSVDVQGPGAAYSKQGERIGFSATQNVDVSQDDGGTTTAVSVSGNEKWVSVFIEFDRALDDPRIDGNSATVFFVRNESFKFSVVQGSEATIGAATRPALDSGKILLADVHRTNGQTSIVNADIDVTRREDAYRLTGTVAIARGTAKEAIGDVLDALNEHIDGDGNQHPAADVTYTGSPNWATGASLTGDPENAEAAIDAVVSDLASTDGASRIGAAATGNLAEGTIRSQLDELDDEKAGLGLANTFTEDNTFEGTVTAETVKADSFEYATPPDREMTVPLGARVVEGSGWLPDDAAPGTWKTDGATFAQPIYFDLLQYLPQGAVLKSVKLALQQPGPSLPSGDEMKVTLYRQTTSWGSGGSSGTSTMVAETPFPTFGTSGTLDLDPSDLTIDKDSIIALADAGIILKVVSAASGVSRVRGIGITFTDPGPRNY